MRFPQSTHHNCHHTFDAVLKEDDKPWIIDDAKGTVVVMMLRRMAYNILTFFRCVTQRGHAQRKTPWRDLTRWFYNTLLIASAQHIEGIRDRKENAPAL